MEVDPTSADIVSAAAVQAPIHLAVTVTVTLFVGILFVVAYAQLCMVIYYGYRLVSYQTVLLFDILLWAALRLTLYSFYFFHCCELVYRLPVFCEWLLVAFPSALQFISLAILVHYFGEVRLCGVYEHCTCICFVGVIILCNAGPFLYSLTFYILTYMYMYM